MIDRLLSNASPEELEKKFPVRFYELTESGTQELTENQYVPYLHRHKYMSIWEMNDRLNHKNPHHLGFRDLIWQFFNDEPPCTPLAIVKRVFLGSRTGQGFKEKRRGCICTPSVGILHPLLYNYQFSNLRRIFKAHISCISSSEKSDDRFYRFCCMI